MAQGVPGRLRPRIFLTFSTTRVVGPQPHAPAAFTPGETLGTHFQRLIRPQGTWFHRGESRKKIPSDTTGNRSQDLPTSSSVPYHYATPLLWQHRSHIGPGCGKILIIPSYRMKDARSGTGHVDSVPTQIRHHKLHLQASGICWQCTQMDTLICRMI